MTDTDTVPVNKPTR